VWHLLFDLHSSGDVIIAIAKARHDRYEHASIISLYYTYTITTILIVNKAPTQ